MVAMLQPPKTKWPARKDVLLAWLYAILGLVSAWLAFTYRGLWWGVPLLIVLAIMILEWITTNRVYAWTNAMAKHNCAPLTAQRLEALANAALTAFGSDPATVVFNNAFPDKQKGKCDTSNRVLYLNPRNANTAVYALHEAAHLVAIDNHGSEYAAVLRDMVVHFGSVAQSVVLDEAKKCGVKLR